MSSARLDVQVLWCGNARTGRSNGWSFPPRVRRHLQDLTAGKRVLQLFGGRASWGVRTDIDPRVRPHVRADAWLPPFRRDAFDVVILDPPYLAINQQMKTQLFRQAMWVARDQLIWFHTIWVAADSKLKLRDAWLVRVGDSCQCRCIQVFDIPKTKELPVPLFNAGAGDEIQPVARRADRVPASARRDGACVMSATTREQAVAEVLWRHVTDIGGGRYTMRAHVETVAAEIVAAVVREAVPDCRQLAELIAIDLFTSGSKERADRLVLTVAGRDLGGWGLGPMTNRIERLLRGRAAPNPDASVRQLIAFLREQIEKFKYDAPIDPTHRGSIGLLPISVIEPRLDALDAILLGETERAS